jgi:hypothetical protein
MYILYIFYRSEKLIKFKHIMLDDEDIEDNNDDENNTIE